MPTSASSQTAVTGDADKPVVRIRGLKKSFGTVKVLDGIDLDVRRGDVVSIIGPSGSGKTTLLRCINALETYVEGSVQVDGVEVGFRDEGNATGKRPRRGERGRAGAGHAEHEHRGERGERQGDHDRREPGLPRPSRRPVVGGTRRPRAERLAEGHDVVAAAAAHARLLRAERSPDD